MKKDETVYCPTAFTIFGVTGDLSKRKLLPSIYHLYIENLLPEEIHFIGVARQDLSEKDYHAMIRESLLEIETGLDTGVVEKFVQLFQYVRGDVAEEVTYTMIAEKIQKMDRRCDHGHQLIFYLAMAPQLFQLIIEQLNTANLTGLCTEYDVKAKIVIEKPFGHDTASAQQLNEVLLTYVEEEQIYRMDHYLGKETVQNILLFRFTNPVINDSWNPKAIDHIQISAVENLGVEERAGYYDKSGALRDMIQSHCLALATLVMMDEPLSLDSQDIHMRKQEILRTFSLYQNDPIQAAVRGQYEGYRAIADVDDESLTETYAAVRLQSSHPNWKDVPIFLQSGKRMNEKVTNISIHFSPCASNICKTQGIQTAPNILNIRVSPEEGVSLRLYAKKPGFSVETEKVNMHFTYNRVFGDEQPSPYERLIHDVIIGDQSLFPSTVEVMEEWRIVQPVLDRWNDSEIPMYSYTQGSAGPEAAHELIGSWNNSSWILGHE